MIKKLLRAFYRWLPLAIVISLFCLLVYVSGQQILRQSANDPQIQMATDIAANLTKGKSPKELKNIDIFDISESLAPFVIVFDDQYKPTVSTASLGTRTPKLPNGVFAYTKQHIEVRVTWQPRDDTRIAAVVRYYSTEGKDGYVLVGRNIKEVEKRENLIMMLSLTTWLISITASFLLYISQEIWQPFKIKKD